MKKCNGEVSTEVKKKIDKMAKGFNKKTDWRHFDEDVTDQCGQINSDHPETIILRSNLPCRNSRGFNEYDRYRRVLRHELFHDLQDRTENGEGSSHMDDDDDVSAYMAEKFQIGCVCIAELKDDGSDKRFSNSLKSKRQSGGRQYLTV